MFLTYSRVLVIFGLLFAAVLIGQISNFVTVEPPVSSDVSNSLPRSGLLNQHRLGDEDQEVFTFVQITDLHISLFSDQTRVEQLSDFCNVNLKAITPKLVLVSGDLTDAVGPDKLIATQFEKEWVIYQNFYQQCLNVSETTTWLDIRGNHDNFNVNGYNSSNNLYPKFGAQRDRFGSYMVTIDASKYTQYAIVAVDATLDLGPKRILNFIGALDSSRIEKLKKIQKTIEENSKVNATIWFGHYASSSILSAWPGLRQVAANGIVYLCGHLHNLMDMVPKMYSHHHSGMLELELADWKLNRMYRVAVMDNGLFSFTDVKHGSWPVIVVTNPKPAETVQPSKEPTALMATSSHIRLLIYSPSPIQLCEVRIDDGPWMPCKLTGKSNPLYTAPWNPDLYSTGLHVLEARAKDSSGNVNLLSVEFSLDGSRSEFPFFGRLILMIDITILFQVLFGLAVAGCVVPFCIIRYIHQRILRRKLTMHRLKYRWLHSFSRKMWIFATTDCLFFPVSFYTLYLTFGPWFAGHVIDGRIGVVFPWGTIFQGHFLSGTFTYFYGLNQIVFFNSILILLLAHTADLRYQKLFIRNPKKETWKGHFSQLPFALFFLVHAFTFYPFWVSYGYMATLLNPLRTWSLVLAVYLWLKAKRLDEASFMNVAKVWI